MPGTVNGVEETVKCFKDLTNVVKRNNELTSEQNQKLVSYTRSLLFLTVVIGSLALIQVLVAIFGKC